MIASQRISPLRSWLPALEARVRQGDGAAALRVLQRIVPGYRPDGLEEPAIVVAARGTLAPAPSAA